MFCQKCGAPLEEQAKCCPECGMPTQEMQTASAAPTAQLPSYDNCEGYSYVPGELSAEAPACAQEPPKKKKRRTLLVVLLAAAALLVIAGSFLLWKFYNSPERQAVSAAYHTYDALMEMTDDLDELEAVLKNVQALTASRSYETRKESTYTSAHRKETSASVYRFDGTTAYGADYLDGDLSMEYSIDREALLVRYAASDSTLRIPLQDFGSEFKNSALADLLFKDLTPATEVLEELDVNLMADAGPKAYLAAKPELLNRLKASVSVTKTAERIPAAPELKTVRLDLDVLCLQELVTDYITFAVHTVLGSDVPAEAILEALGLSEMDTALQDETLYILMGINAEGQLTALHFASDAEDDMPDTIVLCGAENPWEEIRFYANDSLSETVTLTKSAETLTVRVGEQQICINDADATVSLDVNGSYSVTVHYRATEAGAELSFNEDANGYSATTYAIAPLTEPVSMLEAGSAIDIMSMDLTALLRLLLLGG